jgi:methylase of polypeptide subunit release factors
MTPRFNRVRRWVYGCAEAFLLSAAALLLCVGAARAQQPPVPYVPTPQEVVDRMLQMAKVSANDYLIDLGSGDGRIVVTAAKTLGTRGFGVDINPVRVSEAMENAQKAGVTDKAAFYQRDLFQTDLSQASVITTVSYTHLTLPTKLL